MEFNQKKKVSSQNIDVNIVFCRTPDGCHQYDILLIVLLYDPILCSSLDAVCQIWVDIVYIKHACTTCHLIMSDTSQRSLGLGFVTMNHR